jgi:hypothetical protein
MASHRARKPASDLNGTRRYWAVRHGQRAHDPRHHLGPRSEHHRREVHGQRSWDQGTARRCSPRPQCSRRRTEGTRNTSATPSRGRRRDARPAASQPACCATMLERQPGAEVGRQTQRRDHLRGRNPLAHRGRDDRHTATLTEPAEGAELLSRALRDPLLRPGQGSIRAATLWCRTCSSSGSASGQVGRGRRAQSVATYPNRR